MRRKAQKSRCEKRKISKSEEVIRVYDIIQNKYADILDKDSAIKEIRCNVPLDGELDEFMSDFVCVKSDGDLLVRECAFRKYLTKPLTIKLLDQSREYWVRRGVIDWKVIVDAEE